MIHAPRYIYTIHTQWINGSMISLPFHSNLANENEIQYCIITTHRSPGKKGHPPPEKKANHWWLSAQWKQWLRCKFSTFISISSISLIHGCLFIHHFRLFFKSFTLAWPTRNGYLNQHQQYYGFVHKNQFPLTTGKRMAQMQ